MSNPLKDPSAIAQRLQPAPRALPSALVPRVLFGDWRTQFGFAFATVAMIIAVACLPMTNLDFGSYDRMGVASITGVEETSSMSGSRRNRSRIYRVNYTFVDDAGREHPGSSYTVDTMYGPRSWRVEYRSSDPSESRLVGMDRNRFPPTLLLILIFPIGGLALALKQLPSAVRSLRLLRNGLVTSARLTLRQEPTIEPEERQRTTPLVTLIFEYEVGGKTYATMTTTPTHSPPEDDAREVVFYDPRSPAHATLPDHLPGAPTITATGEIATEPGTGLTLLILPTMLLCLAIAAVLIVI